MQSAASEVSPLLIRVAILLAFFAIVAGTERLLRGSSASRWREYLFLLVCGLAGAAYGASNDWITFRLSQEYFVLGKGLPAGFDLQGRVLAMGSYAGFVAAVFCASALVYANNPKPGVPQLNYGALAKHAALCLAPAAGAALVGWGASLAFAEPLQHLAILPTLSPASKSGFITVWSIHVGTYLGLVAGGAWNFFAIRRARIRNAAARPAHSEH